MEPIGSKARQQLIALMMNAMGWVTIETAVW
jgi:hypothetical protein